MIQLAKKIVLLILILVLVERVAGYLLENMFYQQKHGDDFVTIQLMDSSKADILIFGSSRASHHYVSDSIEAYTGMSVYNGGRDNMGIHYIYATLNVVLNRYKPKHIIIDVIPYAFLKGNQNMPKYLDAQTSTLLPFANRHPIIYNSIDEISKMESIKSKMIKSYPFNSLIGSIVQNAYTNMGHSQVKGYEPLHGKIDSINYLSQIFPFPKEATEIDTAAFDLLKRCVQLCTNSHVTTTLVFSPFYFKAPTYKNLEYEFSKIENCQILDYSHDSEFVKKPSLFYDELHLNNEGAIIFVKSVFSELDQ